MFNNENELIKLRAEAMTEHIDKKEAREKKRLIQRIKKADSRFRYVGNLWLKSIGELKKILADINNRS